jgi:AcrR family transcriptional regulator
MVEPQLDLPNTEQSDQFMTLAHRKPPLVAFAPDRSPSALDSEATLQDVFQQRIESASVRRLLLAAVDSFWKNGFHASSTREIARRAKLSSAAVYVHFKSKEELLFTIIVLVAERLLEQLKATAEQEGSPTERLRRLVHDYVAFPIRTHKASLIANTEFNYLTANQRKHIMRIREALEAIVQDCLSEGCATGEFRINDVGMTRTAIISLCRSVLNWYSPRGRLTPQEVGQYYADLAIAMVRQSS